MTDYLRIAEDEVYRLADQVFQAVGVPEEHADVVARNLTLGELHGLGSHGVSRLLPIYVERFERGGFNAHPDMRVLRSSKGAALVDGDHGPGAVVGMHAMRQAIDLAKEHGSGWVGTLRSNHFGAAFVFAREAMAQGMIGFTTTTAVPQQAAYGGTRKVLGTNPLCIAVPGGERGNVILDMATSVVARGKVQLLLATNNGQLEPTETIARYLYRCLDCRLCQQTCPGGVRTDEIFAGARQWAAQTEWLPSPLQDLRQRVEASHNIAGEDNANRSMWQENLDRPIALTEQAEVVFFTGCVSSLYPMVYGIPQSFVQLLAKAGISHATLGGSEWCCGYPLLAAGADADNLIAHNVEAVESLRPRWLVATCPSCHKTWKSDYPDTSFEVVHSTELLLRLLEEKRIQPKHPPTIRRQPGREGPIRITYHDPCDLGRKGNIYDQPREVLAHLPGIEFVEMPTNRALASCCGGGGNLESLENDLSAAIATRRLREAQSIDADVIVTACQQCQRTLGMAARRNRVRLPTMDIAQILLATLDSDDPA